MYILKNIYFLNILVFWVFFNLSVPVSMHACARYVEWPCGDERSLGAVGIGECKPPDGTLGT